MKKLLFAVHEYHRKTKSCDFMMDVFRVEYDVEVVYVSQDDWSNPSVFKKYADKEFDAFVVWQILLPIEKIRKFLHYKVGVFFPMFDQVLWQDPKCGFWRHYRTFHIISFSSSLCYYIKPYGYDVDYVQFCIPPHKVEGAFDPHGIFLWHRLDKISMNVIEAVAKNYRLDCIHLHDAPDPGTKKIDLASVSPEVREKCVKTEWFSDKNMLYEKMAVAALYVAPRKYEGIGMSFLEAMAMGCCVIAPDEPTMNEYITHGENGILYNTDNPSFSFTEEDVARIRKNVVPFMQRHLEKWEEDKRKILSITGTPNVKKSIPAFYWGLFVMTLRKKYRDFRYVLNKRLGC